MSSLSHVIIGGAAGCFIFFCLVIVCLIVIRRRSKQAEINLGHRYRRIDSAQLPDTSDQTLGNIPADKTVVAPQSVTWAEPLTQYEFRKPRSFSCPVDIGAVSRTIHEDSARILHKSADTPTKKRRSTKLRRKKAKTDSCFHVCQTQFVVFYNFYNLKLFVKLVCTVNIPSYFGVTYGSFMKVELLPSMEKFVTCIQYHSNNPVFDESFEFPDISSDDLLGKTLQIKLFTVDRFSHSSLVGTVLHKISEMDISPEKPTTIWKPFTLPGHQYNLVPSKTEMVDQGELYISLRYQVRFNRLTVVVMKATNLPKVNKIFAIDPYVEVTLLFSSNTVDIKKTSCKRRTTSPCWNEPLVFEIAAKIPVSEYSLCFKLKSSNSLCEDVTLGQFDVGYQSEGLGKQHWKEMIEKKNQSRAMCHKLL